MFFLSDEPLYSKKAQLKILNLGEIHILPFRIFYSAFLCSVKLITYRASELFTIFVLWESTKTDGLKTRRHFFDQNCAYKLHTNYIQGGPKKAPYFVFHPKVVFYNFFIHFSGGVDSRPGRFFWHQYGSKWTLYHPAADKNHRGVLCHKVSSSDTAAMPERFWQEQCTWWKDNSTFGAQISKDRKCGRCSQRPRPFIVRHNS